MKIDGKNVKRNSKNNLFLNLGGVPYPFPDGLPPPGVLGAGGVPQNILNGLRPHLNPGDRPPQPAALGQSGKT